ncbi:uncharacterized protein V2V93DRAFT_366512 [Kockiozyma suomiensis]|uniref:uncharacterized protein n=1 Tax=Kockiozyma suomiensis TaxID=1337062 RepID=UPI003343DC7D
MSTNQPGGYNDPLAQVWSNKLVGKKITNSGPSSDTSFPESELPNPSRVIKPGMLTTMDFRPERINVTVDESGIVKHVRTG